MHNFLLLYFLLLIVLFYFVLSCFSNPLSYILFFLGLCVVLTFWQCFVFVQKVVLFQSCLTSISLFPINTMSSAYANTFNCSLPTFIPLGTIFILHITFCNIKLNNIGNSHPVSVLFYFQKRMIVFLLF